MHKKRAYIARFLYPVDVPQEFMQDEVLADVHQHYKHLQGEFKRAHQTVEQVRKQPIHPTEMKAEIATQGGGVLSRRTVSIRNTCEFWARSVRPCFPKHRRLVFESDTPQMKRTLDGWSNGVTPQVGRGEEATLAQDRQAQKVQRGRPRLPETPRCDQHPPAARRGRVAEKTRSAREKKTRAQFPFLFFFFFSSSPTSHPFRALLLVLGGRVCVRVGRPLSFFFSKERYHSRGGRALSKETLPKSRLVCGDRQQDEDARLADNMRKQKLATKRRLERANSFREEEESLLALSRISRISLSNLESLESLESLSLSNLSETAETCRLFWPRARPAWKESRDARWRRSPRARIVRACAPSLA